MGFRGQMHDCIRPVGMKNPFQGRAIGNIGLFKYVPGMILGQRQGLQISGIGQLVHIDDCGLGVLNILAHDS